MSKTFRYDALVVRALAIELAERFAGARLHAVRFARGEWTLRLVTGRGTILWSLHPREGGLRIQRPARELGNVAVGPDSRIVDIRALPDERVLVFQVRSGESPAGETLAAVVVHLFGTHADAFAIDASGVVAASLRGDRADRYARGTKRESPAPSRRLGIEAPVERSVFRSLLEEGDTDKRVSSLLASVAWTSPLNAASILGSAAGADSDDIDAAYRRYVDICHGPPSPVLLDLEGTGQPYPHPLPGIPHNAVADLISAFAQASTDPAGSGRERALAAVAARRERIRRRRERLLAELEGADEEAAILRRNGGLLLSQAHAVRRGQSEAELDDFGGGIIRIELDPALDAAANAESMFDRARKRERAAHRIPDLLQAAADEDARLGRLAERIRAGDESARAKVLERLSRAPAGARDRTHAERLPYRRYQSRNGLEIRVGRGARFNDRLTLRHARPDDIWLHARDVGGAHVVLVWGRRDQNPAEGDLVDAAILAALHSRARTSATVPVDWTRRKYVRKPRKAQPGGVTLERAKTLFVQPDPEVALRLRFPEED